MIPAPTSSPSALPAAAPPSWRLMMSHPAHQLSFGFGTGLIRPAPGTWGTLFAWFVFVVLDPWLTDAAWAAVIAATFALGAVAAERTGKALGRPDHGAIVIDEIVAFWVVLWLLPGGVFTQAVAFVGFRFFDILKPPPIRAVDQRFKNGVGVMLDDLLAAFYTLLVAAVLTRLFA
jgi:phosphatidylglycerophosphatase A